MDREKQRLGLGSVYGRFLGREDPALNPVIEASPPLPARPRRPTGTVWASS